MNDEEIWKTIPSCPKYEASSYGRIRHYLLKKPVKPRPTGRDRAYHTFTCNVEGKNKYFYIHRSVAEAFLGKIEGKNYINHKDGNKKNNALSNLEWCTAKENTAHAIASGLIKSGENHANRKYNYTCYLVVKRFVELGVSGREIQRKLGVERITWTRMKAIYGG